MDLRDRSPKLNTGMAATYCGMLSAMPSLLEEAQSHCRNGPWRCAGSCTNTRNWRCSCPGPKHRVADDLADLPITLTQGDGCTSLIGVLEGDEPGPTVLLRGDMDALPMPEDTGVEFASKIDGVMHACGHDAHTAMLASAARVLVDRRSELKGRVVFMFQPGEEGGFGARVMLRERPVRRRRSPGRGVRPAPVTRRSRAG